MKKKLFASVLSFGLLVHPSVAMAGAKTSFGNGNFTVGKQIQAGIYRSSNIVSSGDCYWSITTTGSNGNDIIANNNSPGGLITLNLSAGQDIKNSCGKFSRGNLKTKRIAMKSSFGNGVWLVGVDVKPGDYTAVKSALGTHCYLAISTAGSNGRDIIANQNYTNGVPTISLASGVEIMNDGCGTFK